MKLCSNPNHTYASLSTDIKEIITVENNQIKGLIGHSIDKILAIPSKRKCLLIGGAVAGEKLKNGSFTGNIGLLQTHVADLYLRFEAPLLHEDFLLMTVPVLREQILVFEELPVGESNEFYDLIENFNVGFELIFWFSLCLTLFFIFKFFLFKMVEPSNTSTGQLLSKFLICFLDSLAETTTILQFCSVFYELYIMIIQLFLTSNVKTNRVVVDTSSIIKSEAEIFQTKRIACFLKGETEEKIAQLFKGSILNKALNEKAKLKIPLIDNDGNVQDTCILKMSLGNMRLIDLSDKYALIRQNTGYVVSALSSSINQKAHAWYIGTPIYEINQIFYYTDFKMTRGFISSAMYDLTEAGFIVKMYNDMNEDAKNSFNREHPLYENLEDYIDSNQGFDDLSIENYENTFRIYTGCSLAILLVFCIDKKRTAIFRLIRKFYFRFFLGYRI